MLKRNLGSFETSYKLSKIIIEPALSNLVDDRDYIYLLLISSLNSEERKWTYENLISLKCTIEQIVNESHKKWKKDAFLEFDEEAIKEMINEAISIAETISKAPSFVEYVGNMTRENCVYKKLKEELIALGEEYVKKAYRELEDPIRERGERYFVEIFSTILLEYYDILQEADIISLISRYNNKEDVENDVELKIVYPLCKVLAILIDETRDYQERYFENIDKIEINWAMK